jgi:hypothetical protein
MEKKLVFFVIDCLAHEQQSKDDFEKYGSAEIIRLVPCQMK